VTLAGRQREETGAPHELAHPLVLGRRQRVAMDGDRRRKARKRGKSAVGAKIDAHAAR
jgi:hypothetical protein